MTDALDDKAKEKWNEAIPMKKLGQTRDIANACVFLGSEMSSYVTGQTLNVDGGLLT
jgi:3-oxoacyl-[acyl-carrier protein] reductase